MLFLKGDEYVQEDPASGPTVGGDQSARDRGGTELHSG